jgi:phosphatidylglycerol:prolipoprotein diacylglycerol transferase
MLPVLFESAGFRIYSYGILMAIGFIAGVFFSRWQGEREGMDPDLFLDIGFWLIFSGILGARLLYILTNLPDYSDNPAEIFKFWKGGLVFYGGVFCAVCAVILFTNRKHIGFFRVGDIFMIGVAIGEGFGRIGCFLAGCCYGLPTSLPWAVTFTDPASLAILGIPVHPTQLYSAALAFTLAGVLFWSHSRKRFDGQTFFLFFLLYSAERFFIEYLRGDEIRGFIIKPYLSNSQGIALPVMVLSALVLFVGWRNAGRLQA